MSLGDIDPPKAVAPESLIRRYEPLGISIRGLTLFVFFFLLTAAVLHADLWVLLTYLSSRPRPQDQSNSIATLITPPPYPPLQPMPAHMNLAFQDLVQLRHAEDDRFRRTGWRIDPVTGQAVIPDRIIKQLTAAGRGATPLFPPVLPPVRSGRAVPDARAGTFPPVETPENVIPGQVIIAPAHPRSAGPVGAYVPVHRKPPTSQPEENSSH
jgi:hypothetical protein